MRYTLAFVAALSCLVPRAISADDWQPPNLVQNPGFEEAAADGKPVGWGNYVTVADVAHAGQRSLFYENADPKRYVLCSQKIALTPGKAYEVSVWVKTEGIAGDESGATLCLEWYGADGKYLGGYYPAGFKGTNDWQRLTGVSGRVAKGAVNCSVLCYLREGITGKAWWDDVEVRQWRRPPLDTLLTRPAYRGEILPETKQLEVFARLDLQDWDLGLRQVALRTELHRRDTGEVVRSVVRTPPGEETTLKLPTKGLAPGRYDLRISAERKRDGLELESESWPVSVPDPATLAGRKSFIDGHNRLLIDGERFFPLGMYWGGITEEDLKLYADSPFNCLMPYGAPDQAQMDLAQRYGLKVIYSVKDVYFGSAYCPAEVKSVRMSAPTSRRRPRPSAITPRCSPGTSTTSCRRSTCPAWKPTSSGCRNSTPATRRGSCSGK
ncbi:MAG: hypothetical protein FJX75_19945 [Armatimonadetes bacterium]|nr:hypothetical protein [Armatimonadota bacterium]